MPEDGMRIGYTLGQAGHDKPPPLIAARGLRYRAGDRVLIDGIDIDIATGRKTVILGANGAGKSLLLRVLHGLTAPEAGVILWQGRPLDAPARRRQAMVFQRPVMLRRSVAANLRFALRVQGFPAKLRREREQAALSMARLEHLAHRPARLLSGGEQQRLAIARALACDPDLLFLDEPTASLDPASTQAIEGLIETAHAAGVTVVLVTHDRGQALRLGQDAVFLADGRVVESGPARDLLGAPRHEATRAWVEGRLLPCPPPLSSPRTHGEPR